LAQAREFDPSQCFRAAIKGIKELITRFDWDAAQGFDPVELFRDRKPSVTQAIFEFSALASPVAYRKSGSPR